MWTIFTTTGNVTKLSDRYDHFPLSSSCPGSEDSSPQLSQSPTEVKLRTEIRNLKQKLKNKEKKHRQEVGQFQDEIQRLVQQLAEKPPSDSLEEIMHYDVQQYGHSTVSQLSFFPYAQRVVTS